jgi:hypothetical protein
MLDRIEVGTLVMHLKMTQWGPGKAVAATGAAVWVYFPKHPGQKPDDRTLKFNLPTDFLAQSPEASHPELDHLPPFIDGRFQVAKTSLTLQHARDRFLGFFPRGFSDPRFWDEERGYKLAAHERFRTEFKPAVRDLIAQRDFAGLRKALINVYIPEANPASGLNLMNPRFEFPAFKESLDSDDALLGYVEAALAFSGQAYPSEADFNRLGESIAQLPTRPGGMQLEKWTVLTLFPFIANPDTHMFLKPEMSQAFAALLPFELQYAAHLNHRTYSRLQAMSQLLKRQLDDPTLNPEARALDMIDVQSFMWAVHDYGSSA